MNIKTFILAAVIATIACIPTASAGSGGFFGERFQQVFYFNGAAGLGAATGLDAGNAYGISDHDIWAIPAGTVIEKVYVIIDTAITGSSAIDIGDDDDPNGFVATAALTLGTPGMYGWNAKVAGAYLRVETAGASDATDIYVVPSAKFYSAAGKEIKLDNTTTNTGGKFRVVVEGYKVGA